MPGYITDHDLLLPAAGEAGTTSNKTPENLLKDQLFGNNKIANRSDADIDQQPSTSSDAAVNSSKQGSGALNSQLFSRSENISPIQVRPFPKAQPRSNNKRKRSRKRKSEILTDTPVKTTIAQAKSSKRCDYLTMHNTICFIKIVRLQDKKRRENQLSLLKKNGIAWYVWNPNPIASQKEFWVHKLGT